MGETLNDGRAGPDGGASTDEACEVAAAASGGRAEAASYKPIEIDLYCLKCGYNLRGLSGDPARCPECGFLNPIEIAEIPAEAIKPQLRRMETAPAISVGALVVFLSMCVPIVGAVVLSIGDEDWHAPDWDLSDVFSFVCAILPHLLFGSVWIVGIVSFRRACLAQVGWRAALIRYQAFTIGMIVTTIGAVVFSYHLSRMLYRTRPEAMFVNVASAVVLLVVLFYWVFRPGHRWLKSSMDRLQRQAAAEIARREIREKMTKR